MSGLKTTTRTTRVAVAAGAGVSSSIGPYTSARTKREVSLVFRHRERETRGERLGLCTSAFGSSERYTVAMSAAVSASPSTVRVERLREAMKRSGVDAFIIPSEDPHMSEYPPDCHARREFISGFDGSAGTAVVTTENAALWTDGRYFLQAEEQLGSEWTLMRAGMPGVPDIKDWLVSTLEEGSKVGIDPTVHTIDAAEALKTHIEDAGMELVTLSENPVDAAWGADRPAAPKAGLRIHQLQWAGTSAADKISSIRQEMKEAGASALSVTMLDEVAWLLNLRGSDVPYNPVFVSYVLITETSAELFIDEDKISDEIAAHLKDAGVVVRPYGEAFQAVMDVAKKGGAIWMDPSKVSFAMKVAAIEGSEKQVGGRKRNRPTRGGPIVTKPSPVSQAKGVKNEAELAGHTEAHLRDGVALAKFLSWLDKTIASGTTLTEVEIDEHLTAQRAAQEGFIEPSFPTIAGAGPNGAVIHYRAQSETCRTVDANTLLLIDSGGQYDCGTTDITRTMHFGTPTEHQKACFTAVLQGHIQLDEAVYPEGTPGCALDTLARTPLWRMGLNYRHGTGHGVGAALNVHEGPQSISHRFGNLQPLLPGMVCSNEPGYYEDGSFGIRIENLFIIVESPTPFRFAGQSYYGSKRLTMCPIQKKMMNTDLMSQSEIDWVNTYHQEVYDAIAPRLEADNATEALEWLKDATSPLHRT
jgi:Xaa-Pro aminopeptidase